MVAEQEAKGSKSPTRVAHKEMCMNRSEEIKTKNKNVENQTEKVVANYIMKNQKKNQQN